MSSMFIVKNIDLVYTKVKHVRTTLEFLAVAAHKKRSLDSLTNLHNFCIHESCILRNANIESAMLQKDASRRAGGKNAQILACSSSFSSHIQKQEEEKNQVRKHKKGLDQPRQITHIPPYPSLTSSPPRPV